MWALEVATGSGVCLRKEVKVKPGKVSRASLEERALTTVDGTG